MANHFTTSPDALHIFESENEIAITTFPSILADTPESETMTHSEEASLQGGPGLEWDADDNIYDAKVIRGWKRFAPTFMYNKREQAYFDAKMEFIRQHDRHTPEQWMREKRRDERSADQRKKNNA